MNWERLLDPIVRRVQLMIGRCVLTAVNDTPAAQEAQISLLHGEVRDKVERFQEYGFTSVPQDDAEGVAVFVGGDRGHGIIIACEDRRYRLKGMEKGEVALYTDEGDMVHFKRGRVVKMVAGSRAVFDTPLAEFTGQVRAAQDITDRFGGSGSSMASMRSVYNTHDHDENNLTDAPTDDPNQTMDGEGVETVSQAFEIRSAALLEETTEDMDELLLCLPDIADAESARVAEPDASGWYMLAHFLRAWFNSPATTDKDDRIRYVSWNWLLQYSRMQGAWNDLADQTLLFSENARAVLAGYLERDGLLSGAGGAFDYTTLSSTDMHARQFQFISVSEYSSIDGLAACVGAFSIYALAKGSVVPVGDGWEIIVSGVSFYLLDGFDFEEEEQFLGRWDCEGLSHDMLFGTTVTNADFRDFRTRHSVGGDFYVCALPRVVDDFEEYVYEI